MRQLFIKIFLPVLLTVLFTLAIGVALTFWWMPDPFKGPPFVHGPHSGPASRPAPGLKSQHEQPPGKPAPPPHDERGPGRPPGDMTLRWHHRMDEVLTLHANALQEVLLREGTEAALNTMEAWSAAWGVQAYLLTEEGADVRHREVPAGAADLARRALETGTVQRDKADRRIIHALRVQTSDAASLVFVVSMPEGRPPKGPPLFRMIFLRLTPVAIGLGLVCYLIARTIVAPILTLRSALRRFAEGDLEQRVGVSVGGRRDEIGELARDFDHMAERIATLLSAERRLLQDISHELRSPLARQRVALELIRQSLGDRDPKALDRAELEAERLDELIGELLTLTRLESRTEGEKRHSIESADLVREVADNATFETSNDERSVVLTHCASCEVVGVPELLRRAVDNVVRNALAYTTDGTTVEISLRQEASTAIICVRDHGPGVPTAELADIFRPFYRVSHARDRETGGVGLGLAIVARAIRSHGGTVTADNHAEGGLLVEMRLPLVACHLAVAQIQT